MLFCCCCYALILHSCQYNRSNRLAFVTYWLLIIAVRFLAVSNYEIVPIEGYRVEEGRTIEGTAGKKIPNHSDSLLLGNIEWKAHLIVQANGVK